MNKEANSSKSKSKKHRSKHNSLLVYLTTPLVFVLISMIVIAPMCFGGMKFAINTVHSAQKVLARDYNDVEAKLDYEPSIVENGTVEVPELSTSQKFGVITCDNAGLYCDVLYGINRVSLRNGVALDTSGGFCGTGKSVEVYGYASTSFKALPNVKVGDVICFETLWGKYTYKVKEKSVLKKAPDSSKGEQLILATEKDKNAFSAFESEKLYVVCEKLSGPDAKEVL